MCRSIVKYTLFIVNLVFTIIGLGLIGGGVAAIYLLDDFFQSLIDNIQINVKFLPYIVIGLGALIFLIAFSGCCGSVTECKCLLITYSIIMLLLAGAKIYLTVVVFTRTSEIKTYIVDGLDNAFDNPNLNKTFHVMEALLKCCGKHGPDDYHIEYEGYVLAPPTCCPNFTAEIQDANNIPQTVQRLSIKDSNDAADIALTGVCFKQDAFQVGCSTLVGDTITTWASITGYTLIGIIVFELLGMIFASIISCTIRRKY